MENFKLSKVPENVRVPFNTVCTLLETLCKEKLNEEYFDLSVKLAVKIARKRPSPFLSGYLQTWAAGIIHALGMVNFLFDKSQSPHMTSRDLCEWFNLGQSTVSGKSKSIRDMFKIRQMDPQWGLPSKVIHNPWVWMVSFNGYIIDVRKAPLEVKRAAYEAGAIPYIPGES